MNIKQTTQFINQQLKSTDINSNEFEAELLIAHILDKTREFVLSYGELSLNPKQWRVLKKLIKKRLTGQPLAQLIHHQAFYNLDFYINNKVLIPRPETELIVEAIINNVRNTAQANTVLVDLGTGSGCIVISLAQELKQLVQNYLAIDISTSALNVAKRNAKQLLSPKTITFAKGNLLQPLLKRHPLLKLDQVNHLIIAANLPYLRLDWKKRLSTTQVTALEFEPELALLSGADGLNHYRQLKTELLQLKKLYPQLDISLYIEIDSEQAETLEQEFSTFGQVHFTKDFSDQIRLLHVKA